MCPNIYVSKDLKKEINPAIINPK
jgi:hypothetical protein